MPDYDRKSIQDGLCLLCREEKGRYRSMRREMTPLGKKISKRLIDLDMTQRELAARIGSTPQYLQKILHGERSGRKYLASIEEILKMSLTP